MNLRIKFHLGVYVPYLIKEITDERDQLRQYTFNP